MSLKHRKIAHKIVPGFGAVLVAVLMMGAGVLSMQARVMDAPRVSDQAGRVLDDVDQASAAIYDQNASARGLALLHAERFVGKYQAAAAAVVGRDGLAVLVRPVAEHPQLQPSCWPAFISAGVAVSLRFAPSLSDRNAAGRRLRPPAM